MTDVSQDAREAATIWKRWHGQTNPLIPTDWTGGDCYFGDGTEGQPKGRQWGAFNDNMVVFYPAHLRSPATGEVGETTRREKLAERVGVAIANRAQLDDPPCHAERLSARDTEAMELAVGLADQWDITGKTGEYIRKHWPDTLTSAAQDGVS